MPLLFSYGTLQQEGVQIAVFGRKLAGERDELVGYERSLVRLEDPRFAGNDDGAFYPIVRFKEGSATRVSGTVLTLSDDDLACADAYEPAPYKRVAVTLASGKQAWVYADERP
jgi:gamma-glutamylcyclotransferase (GGCT)/AIG2-like uncharacterized protein YtfP